MDEKIMYTPNWNDSEYKFGGATFKEIFRSSKNNQTIFKEEGGKHYEVYSLRNTPLFRPSTSTWGLNAWTTKSLEEAEEVLEKKREYYDTHKG